MIESIQFSGALVETSGVPGDTRAEGAVPAHPNGIRVSRDRWLLIYSTRRFRGVDDDASIVYQLRHGGPDGAVVGEGLLARSHSDWDPLGDGFRYVRQHGHPVLFGVPRGALLDGKPAPHANVFVAKWRRVGRRYDPTQDFVEHAKAHPVERRKTQAVEWMQFRLNDAEDSIEILLEARVLRQKGYEEGAAFCSAPVEWMNQSFTPPVPYTPDATQWADCNHFDGGRIAALRYAFNAHLGLYEWVETGPFLSAEGQVLSEASLVRLGSPFALSGNSGTPSNGGATGNPSSSTGQTGSWGEWAIAARTEHKVGAAWSRTVNPFKQVPPPVFQEDLICNGPFTVFMCPDGVLRMCGGDSQSSPHGRSRDPLYIWDVDPRTVATSNRRALCDSVEAGLPLRAEATPVVDMCKLLLHQGNRQIAAFRVRVRAIDHPYVPVLLNEAERSASTIYHTTLTYSKSFPDPWGFDV